MFSRNKINIDRYLTAEAVPLQSSMTRAQNVASRQLYTQPTALHEQTAWRLLAPAQDPFRQRVYGVRPWPAGPGAAKAVARGRTDVCQTAGAPGRPNRVCAYENTKTHDEPLPYRNSTASLIHEAAYISTHNFLSCTHFFFVVLFSGGTKRSHMFLACSIFGIVAALASAARRTRGSENLVYSVRSTS